MHRRWGRVSRPATVIREDDGLDLRRIQRGYVGVLVRLHALEHNRQSRVSGQPRQGRLPRQIGRRAREQGAAQPTPSLIVARVRVFCGARRRALHGAAQRQIGTDVLAALVMLALARHRRVERQDDELDGTQPGDARQHGLAPGAVRLHVQLPAKGLVRGRVRHDLLGRHARVVADDLDGAGGGAGARDAGLAVGVREARHGCRGDEYGQRSADAAAE